MVVVDHDSILVHPGTDVGRVSQHIFNRLRARRFKATRHFSHTDFEGIAHKIVGRRVWEQVRHGLDLAAELGKAVEFFEAQKQPHDHPCPRLIHQDDLLLFLTLGDVAHRQVAAVEQALQRLGFLVAVHPPKHVVVEVVAAGNHLFQ